VRKAPKAKSKKAPRKTARPQSAQNPSADDERIVASDLTLHDLFQQQTASMLDRADISEEQKQSILIAMSCPCCGAGGMSFTMKLKRN
jgi:hypothetical protein